MNLDELLAHEGVSDGKIDALIRWANDRAADLVEGLETDPVLGPLLAGARDAGGRANGFGQHSPRAVDSAAPLPPIPGRPPQTVLPDPSRSDREVEEIEAEEIELLDDDDLELVDEEDPDPAASFGPPDGTDDVPAWKAALLSAEYGDHQAVEKIREESRVEPLPTAPPAAGGRLRSEEDEISQHNIDLSDLDDEPRAGRSADRTVEPESSTTDGPSVQPQPALDGRSEVVDSSERDDREAPELKQ